MAIDNPMVGGPDFVRSLCAAIEQQPNAFLPRAPATGGTQISLRLREDRLNLIDTLSERSGWNRNQIIDALIDGSLFQLFAQLSDATAAKIRSKHVAKVLEPRRRQRSR